MLETWSENVEIICKEIRSLIDRQIPLHIYAKGQKPIAAKLIAFEENPLGRYLLLQKDSPIAIPNELFLVTYHLQGGLLRGFQTMPHLEVNNKLKVHFPKSLLQIQRRKHERYALGQRSKVIFSRKNRSKLLSGFVENICKEGARIVGDLTPSIEVNEILSPVTFTLRLEKGDVQETIIVQEVTVRRIEERPNEERALGVNFSLETSESSRLENFLSLCALLSKTGKKKANENT